MFIHALAYRLLLELADREVDTLSPQADFMRLSLDERRRILAQQAEQMKAHYQQTAIDGAGNVVAPVSVRRGTIISII